MAEAFYAILTGVLIAVISSWITVQLSIRQFRSEKWWERKVEAYSRVIEALHHSKAFCDAHLDASYTHGEVAEDRDHELRRRSKEAHSEIDKAADIAGFLLSAEAQERLVQYRIEAKDSANTNDWHEYLEGDWAATNSCLVDLIKLAKRDLRTK